jgi:hypothetical protein
VCLTRARVSSRSHTIESVYNVAKTNNSKTSITTTTTDDADPDAAPTAPMQPLDTIVLTPPDAHKHCLVWPAAHCNCDKHAACAEHVIAAPHVFELMICPKHVQLAVLPVQSFSEFASQ